MELVTPGIGLIFWMTLSFGIVLIILRNYAWKPILSTIKERENYIAGAIRNSKKIERELAEIEFTKEKMLQLAKNDADDLIKKAKSEGEIIIQKAQLDARKEATQIIESAKNSILAERKAAEREIREQIVLLSIDVAQKVIREEFQDVQKKNQYINKLLEDIQLN
jgi:F-type H+-transporting ATPase subunit b